MGKRTVLITGIAGGLARLVGRVFAERGFAVVGVDYRRAPQLDFCEAVYRANYNKTKIEDVFRHHRPARVLHLGRVGNLKERLNKRFDLNVIGSRKVMDLSAKYGVERLVVMSTFHIYGAHPANHIPIYEADPLRAGTTFPQIADAIQFDSQAVTWIYQHPEVPSAVLRPCNVIGPEINNAMSRFLRQTTLPVIMGFDPMTQLIHQRDMVAALVAVTESSAVGMFNVAGRGALPWREALAVTGARIVPVPEFIAKAYLRVGSLFTQTLPAHLIDFFKYPCVIADDLIRQTFGWEPQIGPAEAVYTTVTASSYHPSRQLSSLI